MRTFTYLNILRSPFKLPKLYFYFGRIRHGTPYFLPRKWVKDKEKKGYMKAIPIKWFGYNSCDLGWKTKWSDTDIRFEWSPCYSLVIFGFQLFVSVIAPNHNYWESWLYYNYHTDKDLSKEERIKACIKDFPQKWTSYSKTGNVTTDYYPLILRKKYIPLTDNYEL